MGYVLKGRCSYSLLGSPYEQSGQCAVTATGPSTAGGATLHIKDDDAQIGLHFNGTFLEIAMGLTMPNSGIKGNNKLEMVRIETLLEAQYLLVPPPGGKHTGFKSNKGAISVNGVSAIEGLPDLRCSWRWGC